MQQSATHCLPSPVYPVNELTEEGLGTAAMRRSLSEKLFCFCRKSFRSKLQRLPLQRLGKITAEQRIKREEKGVERWGKRLLGQRKRKQGMLTENKQQTAQWHWFLRALSGIRPQNGPTQVIINTHRAQGRPRRLPWREAGGKLSSLAQLHANGSTL